MSKNSNLIYILQIGVVLLLSGCATFQPKTSEFNLSETAEATIKELNGNGKNMFYLGVLTKFFNVDKNCTKERRHRGLS